jgi:hypothetical protein
MKNKLLQISVLLSLFLASCSSDDNSGGQTSNGDFEAGVFILNEGGSSLSTASISFISESGNLEHDIFRSVNPNADEIGIYLQSMFFDDDRAFIISGGSNIITVVNRNTFEYITTISTGLSNPRYGVTENGKAYVVNQAGWESGADDYLAVINLNTYAVSSIPLGMSSDRIIEANDKIYVSNGYYGDGNSITVINPVTDTIEAVIDLGDGNSPNSLDEEDGFLYVLTTNNPEYKIQKISLSNHQIVGERLLSPFMSDVRNLTIEDDIIYYTNVNSVYAVNIANFENENIGDELILTYEASSEWSAMYGFAVEDGKIYIADAGDFASDGKVFVYSTSGNLLNTYTVGIAPNGFYFND